jgi:hypothetical protein
MISRPLHLGFPWERRWPPSPPKCRLRKPPSISFFRREYEGHVMEATGWRRLASAGTRFDLAGGDGEGRGTQLLHALVPLTHEGPPLCVPWAPCIAPLTPFRPVGVCL